MVAMAIVILTGPPGAGKTTLIQAVARQRSRCAAIDVDDLRWMLLQPHVAPWGGPEGHRQRVLGVRNACCLARNFAADGCDVLIADTVTEETAGLYRAELGRDLIVVALRVSLEEARRRAASRPYHLTDDELVWVYREQEALTVSDRFLDTDQKSVSDAALIISGIMATLESPTAGPPTAAPVGMLEKTVIDCPDPRALADFYKALLGMQVNEDLGTWVVIGRAHHLRQLAFQQAPSFVAPRWPDPSYPQQLHLDIRVDDIDTAEPAVVALGARRAPGQDHPRYRVFLDPVGHPFCLVFGRRSDRT